MVPPRRQPVGGQQRRAGGCRDCSDSLSPHASAARLLSLLQAQPVTSGRVSVSRWLSRNSVCHRRPRSPSPPAPSRWCFCLRVEAEPDAGGPCLNERPRTANSMRLNRPIAQGGGLVAHEGFVAPCGAAEFQWRPAARTECRPQSAWPVAVVLLVRRTRTKVNTSRSEASREAYTRSRHGSSSVVRGV